MTVLRLLIADDEEKERDGIERLLVQGGFSFEITKAVNGEDALHLIEKQEFDVLLTDIKMPFLNGIQLIEAVQNLGKRMVFIIYSAYGEFEYAQSAVSLGVLKYLLKPIEIEEFHKLFSDVEQLCLEQARAEEEREQDAASLRSFKLERLLLTLLESDNDHQNVIIERAIEISPELAQLNYTPVLVSDRKAQLSGCWETFCQDVEQMTEEPMFFILNGDNQALLLLFQKRKTRDTEKLRVKLGKLLDKAKTRNNLELLLVVGRTLQGLEELRSEYSTLEMQLEYQFFLSGGAVFFHDRDYLFSTEQDMVALYFDRIYNSVRVGSLEEAQFEFERVFQHVEENIGFSPIYIKYVFTEGIKEIYSIMGHEMKLSRIVESVHLANSFEEIKKTVRNMLASFAKQPEVVAENRVVKMAKELVFQQYSHGGMGLAYIADKLEVSPAYLSSLFKKETGQNLVKFITEYRMDKAKEMLRQSNKRISDVSAAVGYANQSYFIALFRGREGMSPSQYREKAHGG